MELMDASGATRMRKMAFWLACFFNNMIYMIRAYTHPSKFILSSVCPFKVYQECIVQLSPISPYRNKFSNRASPTKCILLGTRYWHLNLSYFSATGCPISVQMLYLNPTRYTGPLSLQGVLLLSLSSDPLSGFGKEYGTPCSFWV